MNAGSHLITLFLVAAGIFLYDTVRHNADESRNRPVADTETVSEHGSGREREVAALTGADADLGPLLEAHARLADQLAKLEARLDNLVASTRATRAALPISDEGTARHGAGLGIEQFEALLALSRKRAHERALARRLHKQLQRLSTPPPAAVRDEIVAATLSARVRAREIRAAAVDASPEADLHALERDLGRQIAALVGEEEAVAVLAVIGSVATNTSGSAQGSGVRGPQVR